MKKIILLELNEVPFKVLDHYINLNPKSNLANFMKKSTQLETMSEDTGDLSPWITWPSLHRGISNKHHRINDINQDLKAINQKYPPIWKALKNNNIKVGVFGSLQSYEKKISNQYSFYLPDTFAPMPTSYPSNLELFQSFNLNMVNASGLNVDSSIQFKNSLKFLLKSKKEGITYKTYLKTALQILHEKINHSKRSRRRTFQFILSADIFMKNLNKHKPDFVTFFTNHVASSMHRFWAATFPEDYKSINFSKDWIENHKNEIIYTLDQYDLFLGQVMKFSDKNNYSVISTSSMGQSSINSNNKQKKTVLSIFSADSFFDFLKVSKYEKLPSMFPQFNYQIENQQELLHAAEILELVSINNSKISYRISGKMLSLDLGHPNEITVKLKESELQPEVIGLRSIKVDEEHSATAYHIPEGHYLNYSPFQKSDNSGHREQISSLEIFPAILKNYNITPPNYLKKTNLKIY